MAPLIVPGSLAISHAIARELREGHDPLVRGTRSNPAVRDRGLTQDVTDDEFEAAFAAKLGRAGERSEAKAASAKAKKARNAAKAAGDDEARERAEAEMHAATQDATENKEVQVQQLLNYPFIEPGTVFDSTIRLMRVSDRGLALFARAFDRFAAFARLGGHAGQGMGLMDGAWEILARPSEGRLVAPARIGAVSFKGEDYAPAVWEGSPSEWADAAPAAEDIHYLLTPEPKEAA